MRRAFTLSETMVVIAIMLVVAAIVFPVIARAKQGASITRCISNLRQLGVAAAIYAADYDGSPLATDRVGMGLPMTPFPLVKDLSLFECGELPNPSGRNAGYNCFFCFSPEAEPWAAVAWKDHVEKMGQRAMLFVDINHGSPPTHRTAEYVTHRVFGVQVDTSIRRETKRGAPDLLPFWNR